MGHPWPKPPQEDGTGSSPTDLQRIVGAQYVSSGLLPNGGGKTTGTSSMAYNVAAGACFMWASFDARLGMLIPFEKTTVQTDPAPATGSRTDTIYVDGDGGVRVAIGSKTAPTGVIIGQWTVPAGITATTAAVQSVDRKFAIAAGTSLGLLHSYYDPAADGAAVPSAAKQYGAGRFYLPSDRLVRLDMTHCMGSSVEDDQQTSVVRWRVFIDGYMQTSFVSRNEYWWPQTKFFSFCKPLAEGVHTVHYVQQLIGGAPAIYRKGGSDAHPGNRFEVWDAGVSQ